MFTKKFWVWITIIVVIVGAFAIYQKSPRSPHNRVQPKAEVVSEMPKYPSDPNAGLILPMIQLEGDWSWKKDDTAFIATVKGNDIKVMLTAADGMSAVYWHGTFMAEDSLGSVITSTKTESSDEIVLSQSPTKDFKINADTIEFTFSALGVSRTVALSR